MPPVLSKQHDRGYSEPPSSGELKELPRLLESNLYDDDYKAYIRHRCLKSSADPCIMPWAFSASANMKDPNELTGIFFSFLVLLPTLLFIKSES